LNFYHISKFQIAGQAHNDNILYPFLILSPSLSGRGWHKKTISNSLNRLDFNPTGVTIGEADFNPRIECADNKHFCAFV
jgi:hypothetical protein